MFEYNIDELNIVEQILLISKLVENKKNDKAENIYQYMKDSFTK